MIQGNDFCRVCPIHLQLLWRISSSVGCCLVRFQSSLLLMVSGHRIRTILLRQVSMGVWIFFNVAAVVLRISAPYSRTDFTVVLQILVLMFMVRLGEAHMFFIWRKAVFALPVLTLLHRHQSPPPPPPPLTPSNPSLFVNNAFSNSFTNLCFTQCLHVSSPPVSIIYGWRGEKSKNYLFIPAR